MLPRRDNESGARKAARLAGYFALHPAAVPLWLADRFRPAAPMTRRLPWIAWDAIRWLETWLQPQFTVYEFGGGGSTLWFAERVAKVVTLEDNTAWLERLREVVPRNVTLIQGETPALFPKPRADLIVVDGRRDARPAMLRWALQQGTAVLLDDSWRLRSLLPAGARTFVSIGPCRLGVTETAIVLPEGPAAPTPASRAR